MLYLKVINGVPVDHPVFADNLVQAFGEIPAEYVPFTRLPPPVLGPFQVHDETAALYAELDGVWQDVWPVRDMNAEEVAEKEANLRAHIETIRSFILEHVDELKAEATDPEYVAALEEHKSVIEGFVVADILNPDFPLPPLPKGHPLNLPVDASGSAPDMIG